jgi:hypothetical protein
MSVDENIKFFNENIKLNEIIKEIEKEITKKLVEKGLEKLTYKDIRKYYNEGLKDIGDYVFLKQGKIRFSSSEEQKKKLKEITDIREINVYYKNYVLAITEIDNFIDKGIEEVKESIQYKTIIETFNVIKNMKEVIPLTIVENDDTERGYKKIIPEENTIGLSNYWLKNIKNRIDLVYYIRENANKKMEEMNEQKEMKDMAELITPQLIADYFSKENIIYNKKENGIYKTRFIYTDKELEDEVESIINTMKEEKKTEKYVKKLKYFYNRGRKDLEDCGVIYFTMEKGEIRYKKILIDTKVNQKKSGSGTLISKNKIISQLKGKYLYYFDYIYKGRKFINHFIYEIKEMNFTKERGANITLQNRTVLQASAAALDNRQSQTEISEEEYKKGKYNYYKIKNKKKYRKINTFTDTEFFNRVKKNIMDTVNKNTINNFIKMNRMKIKISDDEDIREMNPDIRIIYYIYKGVIEDDVGKNLM